MNRLLLDTKLLENKGNLSKIWGVPIKTKSQVQIVTCFLIMKMNK